MEVKIYNDIARSQTNLLFFEQQGDKRVVYNLFNGSSLTLSGYDLVPDEYICKIPGYISESLFSALAEALDKNGVRTDKDAKIEGTLEATKFHLQDLRKLLKLN